jgi:hypothetical protein
MLFVVSSQSVVSAEVNSEAFKIEICDYLCA